MSRWNISTGYNRALKDYISVQNPVYLDDKIVYCSAINIYDLGVESIDPVCGVNVIKRILTGNNGYFL